MHGALVYAMYHCGTSNQHIQTNNMTIKVQTNETTTTNTKVKVEVITEACSIV
jgi:hypothetical protein